MFYISSTPQFELAKFPVLNRHVWLLATGVNSAILNILFFLRKAYIKFSLNMKFQLFCKLLPNFEFSYFFLIFWSLIFLVVHIFIPDTTISSGYIMDITVLCPDPLSGRRHPATHPGPLSIVADGSQLPPLSGHYPRLWGPATPNVMHS